MNRAALEHIIRASGAIANDTHIVVVGSQAILGQYPNAPTELLASMEADVYPKHDPGNALLIDGAIGERSMFHETFGYYARGVGPDTAVLPDGWQDRIVPVCNENTRGYTGECLEAHDLAISKLVAGREKDVDFVRALLTHALVSRDTLEERVTEIEEREGSSREQSTERLRLVASRLRRL